MYVEPNQEGNGHLVYRLDKDQVVVTKNYRTVPVPEDMDHTSVNDEDQHTQEDKEILRLSLLISLRDKSLRSSLLVSLQYGLLQLSLLTSLRHRFLQSSLLVSLRSNTVHTFTLLSLWNIFLRCLYENISTIIRIKVKPKIYSYNYLYKDISTATPIRTNLKYPNRGNHYVHPYNYI